MTSLLLPARRILTTRPLPLTQVECGDERNGCPDGEDARGAPAHLGFAEASPYAVWSSKGSRVLLELDIEREALFCLYLIAWASRERITRSAMYVVAVAQASGHVRGGLVATWTFTEGNCPEIALEELAQAIRGPVAPETKEPSQARRFAQ